MLDRPLLWSAVGFAAGLLTQHPALPPARWALLASALLIGALILSICATCMATLRFGSALAFAGLFAAGRVACEGAALAHPESLAALAARHPALLEEGVELSGRLVRSHPVQAADTDAAIDLVVDVERTRLRGDARPSRGRVRIRVAPPLPPAPERGDLVTAFARVRLPRPFRNPGSFDYVRYLRGRGIEALASVKSGRLVTIGHSDDLGARVRLMRRVDRLRAWLLHRLETTFDGTIEGRRGAAVSAALLLGERGRLSAEETLLLQESGLSHLLAVSGFNVAVLAGLLFLPLRAAGLSFRGAAPMVIGVLVLYLLVNQDESSVARAVVMAVAWLAGRCLWRRPDPLNTLGLAGLTLLAQAPDQVHDPGFQLTFVATLGLILFLAAPHRAAGRARVRGPGRERTPRIARAASAALAVTLVATLATMPLGAVHFNRVTPGAVPANLIAGPLMAAAFVGVVAIEAAVVLPDSVARGAARLVSALVGGTFEVAEAVRGVPGLTWRRPTPGACLVATHYAALGCAAVMRRRRRAGLAGPAVWLLAAGSGALLAAPLDTRAAPEGLLVTMLDVGQGEAVLVETPGRARILFDAGGFARGQFDTGDRVVGPALWRMGIASLDLLVVTHGDIDHAGGAAAVVRAFGPRAVWLPARPAGARDPAAVERLVRAARRTGALVRRARRGDSLQIGGARLDVLNPPAENRPPRNANEDSLVAVLSAGGRRILLAGDAGAAAESSMRSDEVRADLLKAGHHGSRSASSEAFLAAVKPSLAFISCGRMNRFGHPHRETLARLQSARVRVCRTDLHGAVWAELQAAATRLSSSCALSASSE